MNTWSFADQSGTLVDRVYSGPTGGLAANTPAGCIAVPGMHPHHSRRVEWQPDDFGDGYPIIVPYQPPAPPADELQTWSWSAEIERWVSAPTLAAVARDMRAERDRRLAVCDWVTARALDTSEPVPLAWAIYRRALRDVTQQPGFPTDIAWPQPPGARP